MIDITNLSDESVNALLSAGPGVDAVTELLCSGDKFGCEVLLIKKETEKALLIEGSWFLPSRGNWTGHAHGTELWVPKSQIKEELVQDGEKAIVLSNWFANQLANKIKAGL